MAELLQTERTFVKDLENCINVSSLVRDQEWLIVYCQTEWRSFHCETNHILDWWLVVLFLEAHVMWKSIYETLTPNVSLKCTCSLAVLRYNGCEGMFASTCEVGLAVLVCVHVCIHVDVHYKKLSYIVVFVLAVCIFIIIIVAVFLVDLHEVHGRAI